MRFLLVLLSLVSFSYAQTEKTIMAPLPTQKVEEAKPFLVHKAVLEVLKENASTYGIDFLAFENKLNEKFEKFFAGYKEKSISKTFGKNYSKELSEEQKKAHLEGIDRNKNELFVSYSKLSELLDSYSFKSIEKQPAPSEDWKASLILNLSRSKIDKYKKRLFSEGTKEYSKLQVLVEVTPLGFSWPELNLEKSTSFTNPLLTSWGKWLSTNQPQNVEEIVLCEGVCHDAFNQWQQVQQEEGMQIPSDLANSLWLKVSYNLRKVFHNSQINEWKFEWDGSVVLLDANTKKILASHTLHPETKTWRGLDQKTLNSNLASGMYRSPLDSFNKITKQVQDSNRINRLNRLRVQGYANMGDIVTLMETIKKLGHSINLDLKLDVFTQKEAQILCFYVGEEKSFTDLLSSVKELKLSHSYKVVDEHSGVHHVLRLIAE